MSEEMEEGPGELLESKEKVVTTNSFTDRTDPEYTD
jgi:hypothetical protein